MFSTCITTNTIIASVSTSVSHSDYTPWEGPAVYYYYYHNYCINTTTINIQ